MIARKPIKILAAFDHRLLFSFEGILDSMTSSELSCCPNSEVYRSSFTVFSSFSRIFLLAVIANGEKLEVSASK
jgi:hypothetical protein